MIERSVYELMHKKPFYGYCISRMIRVYDNTIYLAMISVTNNQVKLYINPDRWNEHTITEQAAVLEHEIKHLICDHVTTRRSMKGGHKLNNYAADLAVNCGITGLPDSAVTVEKFRKYIPDLQKDGTIEYYREQLLKLVNEIDDEDMDDHSGWSDEAIDRHAVRNFFKESRDRYGAGNVPGDVLIQINKLLESVTDWRKYLNNFIESNIEDVTELTRKKRNRRTGILNEGKRLTESLHLAWAIDDSGSMSHEAISQAFAEMKRIHGLGTKITVMVGDAEISNVFDFDPSKIPDLKGGGGTSYQPFLDKAAELRVDGIVVFGDMECFDQLSYTKVPVMWAMTPGASPPASFGIPVTINL
jgi:predicted metal-dependent peptidase